jgi:hypothetical protein
MSSSPIFPSDDPFETLLDSARFDSFFNKRWLGSQAQVLKFVESSETE